MKLLVVDDERSILDHLAHLKEWTSIGARVVGQAENGAVACALIERLRPDIVITDIRMPVMDGIELAEWVKIHYPDVKMIFLTAYSEFEYAKQAVKLGISDFIIKPFVPAELAESVKLLHQERLRSTWSASESRETLLQAVLDPMLTEGEKAELVSAAGMGEMEVVLTAVETDNAEWLRLSGKSLSKLAIREVCHNVCKEYPHEYWTTLSAYGVHLLFFRTRSKEDTLLEDVFVVAKELLSACNAALQQSVSVAVSSVLPSLADYAQGVAEVQRGLEYRMLFGERSLISAKALEQLREEQQYRRTINLNDLTDLMRQGRSESIPAFMRAVYREIVTLGLNKEEVHLFALELVHTAETTAREFGQSYDPHHLLGIRRTIMAFDILSQLIKLLEKTILELVDAINRVKEETADSKIGQIRRYIEEHYMEDISLQTISDRLYLNYSYASRLIKKETGHSFGELLADKRVQEAKKLLATTGMKAYEIAYAVGYKDPAHFSHVFKKLTGMSPNDYK